MLCPHCSTIVHLSEKTIHTVTYEWSDLIEEKPKEELGNYIYCYRVNEYKCPACDKLVVILEKGVGEFRATFNEISIVKIISEELLYPKLISRISFSGVPERFNNDYRQAVSILNISPKASAALSRRLLQDVLQNHYKIKKKNLEEEIKEFISMKEIPSGLADTVNAIREIGNYAAHPKKGTHPDSILEVEPEEAVWMIEVIEAIFDYTFIQKIKDEKRKLSLKNKLKKSN